jgi:hypothetical protein
MTQSAPEFPACSHVMRAKAGAAQESRLFRNKSVAARRRRLNRSALVRDALRAYLRQLETLERERRDREGYTAGGDAEFRI